MSTIGSNTLAIRGIGLVTPLGCGVEEVWRQLLEGNRATAEPVPAALVQPEGRVPYYYPVGLKPFDALGRIARIRRSSAISSFSVAAGLQALGIADARAAALPPERAGTTAVIFAICSGGVHYTRRFYEKIVAEGAQAASPLLFPETVYNAPASHLSALLGIDGASYTVVGDGTVGLSALAFARELLACQPELEECVVVGAEECDWILWEGYNTWRLLSREPRVELQAESHGNRGMILAEGGGALVVGRSRGEAGEITIPSLATGSYFSRREAAAALEGVLESFDLRDAACVVGSANGTWVGQSEAAALDSTQARGAWEGNPSRYYPKVALGDALGAGALWQVALAATALSQGELPGLPTFSGGRGAIVTAIGLNQQVAGAVLERQ